MNLASKILIVILLGIAWLVTMAFTESGAEQILLTIIWGIVAALLWINT